MRRLARVQRFDFWIALMAIFATLVVGVLAGVMIGIALSMLWLMPSAHTRTCQCSDVKRAPRSSATSRRTRRMSRRPASLSSGWTAVFSSPPRSSRGPSSGDHLFLHRPDLHCAQLRRHRLHRLPGLCKDGGDCPPCRGVWADSAACSGQACGKGDLGEGRSAAADRC